MKTFILILLVGACFAATFQKSDFKRKRNGDALRNPKHSPGKAARSILKLLSPRNVRRESKNNDVEKRLLYSNSDFYTGYNYWNNTDNYTDNHDWNYPNYDNYTDNYFGIFPNNYTDNYYWNDYSWIYDDNYYDDYYYGYWQGYWYGYYMGLNDGNDFGYVDGNANGFDIGFSNGFFEGKYRYSYYKKRDVGKRPMKRSKTEQDSNAYRNAALKTNDDTEKAQM